MHRRHTSITAEWSAFKLASISPSPAASCTGATYVYEHVEALGECVFEWAEVERQAPAQRAHAALVLGRCLDPHDDLRVDERNGKNSVITLTAAFCAKGESAVYAL